MLHIRTERLLLVAATLEHVQAELAGTERLAQHLGAHVSPLWPPPLNDERTLRWTLDQLEADPEASGWLMWYFLHREHGRLEAVGSGGFHGRPDAAGKVEVGYSILPSHHRLGFAPEAVRALVDWAFSHAEVERVVAQTLPALLPSIRVLEKCGFRGPVPGSEEGTIQFERTREEHQAGA